MAGANRIHVSLDLDLDIYRFGMDILFLLFHRPALHLVSTHLKEKCNSYHRQIWKFGMQDYWVNSLLGIAFGEGSSIAS